MRTRCIIVVMAAVVAPVLISAPGHAAICEVYRRTVTMAADSDVDMIVRSGMDCRIRFAEDELFEVETNEVTTRPRYGGVRLNGNSGAYYRSNPGYKGRDRFTFTLCGSEDGKQGCSNIRVKVFVR